MSEKLSPFWHSYLASEHALENAESEKAKAAKLEVEEREMNTLHHFRKQKGDLFAMIEAEGITTEESFSKELNHPLKMYSEILFTFFAPEDMELNGYKSNLHTVVAFLTTAGSWQFFPANTKSRAKEIKDDEIIINIGRELLKRLDPTGQYERLKK